MILVLVSELPASEVETESKVRLHMILSLEVAKMLGVVQVSYRKVTCD